ncbi:MAG: pilus (MSHA type) biogenesis protein MshL [Desulfobulbus sp.]|jgi:MSHA type pilus biogenesis protein MshL
MKGNAYLTALCIVVLIPLLASCGTKKQTEKNPVAPVSETMRPADPLPTLPVRYQTPGYITPQADPLVGMLIDNARKEHQIRVGATIRSTGGPLPLWDVMKRLTALKEMTVSWASDVDQTMPVDVDISADEGFFDAIANLLRQVDYFHEVNGRTIIVRNKTTKTYQIAIPLMQGGYTSTVGGNFLAGKEETSGSEGTVKITSAENKFNVWENIETNLRTLLDIDAAERAAVRQSMAANMQEARRSEAGTDLEEGAENVLPDAATTATTDTAGQEEAGASIGQNSASDGSSFMVDRSIGLITVTAKPSVLKKVDDYVDNLKKHLFRQVSIEAKIIEVYLEDQSKIGLDWSSILRDFQVRATTEFGSAGQVHPHTSGGNPDRYSNTFVSRVFMPSLDFSVFLNALKEQGDTQVLANPRLTVLNGQPALISVGKDVAYVKSVKKDVSGTGSNERATYSAEAGNVVQGIALGVMPSIVDNSKVILHLTPITTELENLDEHGDVPMTHIGGGAISLGLPRVKVREMSTMVEVQDSEMLIIGGLIDSLEGNKASGLPGVSKIPVLKYLFGYEEKIKQKRELVILLTPKIL